MLKPLAIGKAARHCHKAARHCHKAARHCQSRSPLKKPLTAAKAARRAAKAARVEAAKVGELKPLCHFARCTLLLADN